MSKRIAFWLAWFTWIFYVVIAIVTLLFQMKNAPSEWLSDIFGALVLFAFATVVALIASRRPQNPNGRTSEEMDLSVNNDKKRISRYHIQAFWILLTTFTLSLGYEVYREISKASVSSFDTFNPALVIFYLLGFGMTVLVRTNQRWAWWLVLLFTLGLIALGTFYYDPVILPARHPGPLDWFESVAYLGLLFIATFLCLQQLRGHMLVPGEHPFS